MMLALVLLVQAMSLKVYVVPHSHVDTAWLETPEAYYETRVKGILDSVVAWLEADPTHKFAWAELFFFSKWFKEAKSEQQDSMRRAVKVGQLEFVGGWVQQDATLTDIDMQTYNIAVGRRYLRDTFNVTTVPVAWEIDSFGCSALTPAVLLRFGYRYLVVNRVDAELKMYLRHRSSMEFLWAAGAVGSNARLLTHVLGSHYDLPLFLNPASKDFCFRNATMDRCAQRFVELMQLRSQFTSSSSVLFLYGDDFAFAPVAGQPSPLFSSLQQLLSYFRASRSYPNLKVVLATPSEYFDAVYRSDRSFAVFSAELLPYMQSRDSSSPQYWTGYYSTNPNLKKSIRSAMSAVRSAGLLSAFVLREDYSPTTLALGLHHDGIAGTMRPAVAAHLAETMRDVKEGAEEQIRKAALHMLRGAGHVRNGRAFVFVNSLNWPREEIQALSHSHPFVEVISPNGTSVPAQYLLNASDANYTIYFSAVLPSLSASVYFLKEHTEQCQFCAVPSVPATSRSISNGELTITVAESGYLASVSRGSERFAFRNMEFRTYSGAQSGAYVFKPVTRGAAFEPFALLASDQWTGPVVSLSRSVWAAPHNASFAQTLLLPTHSDFFHWSLSTFALGNDTMIEAELEIPTDSPWFHTFSDGELRQRVFFEPVFSARVGKNFVPVTSALVVGNSSFGLSLFPDYVLGAGMVAKGSFALHLHRSPSEDDGNGLEEGFVDESCATHSFRVALGPASDKSLWKHSLEQASHVVSWDAGLRWERRTAAHIAYSSEAAYFQSIDFSEDESLLRVLSLRAHSIDVNFTGFRQSTGLGGSPVPAEGVLASGVKLCWETCANGAPAALLRAHSDAPGSELRPYEFVALLGNVTDTLVEEIQPHLRSSDAAETLSTQYEPTIPQPLRPEEGSSPAVLSGLPYAFMAHEPQRPSSHVVPSPVPPSADFWVQSLLEFLSLVLLAALVALLCRRK